MTTLEAQRLRQRIQIGLELPILALVVFLFVWQIFVVNPQTVANHAALCANRADLIQRVAASEHFLKHPQIAPAFDTPQIRSLIRAQDTAERQTIANYSVLSCD